MGRRALVLLRHGTPLEEAVDPARHLSDAGKAQAAFAANGLCAYLELPSTFVPMAYGEPCPVAIFHSGKERAAQTAKIVNDGLSAAKCETTLTECVAAASNTSAIPTATSAESHCTTFQECCCTQARRRSRCGTRPRRRHFDTSHRSRRALAKPAPDCNQFGDCHRRRRIRTLWWCCSRSKRQRRMDACPPHRPGAGEEGLVAPRCERAHSRG